MYSFALLPEKRERAGILSVSKSTVREGMEWVKSSLVKSSLRSFVCVSVCVGARPWLQDASVLLGEQGGRNQHEPPGDCIGFWLQPVPGGGRRVGPGVSGGLSAPSLGSPRAQSPRPSKLQRWGCAGPRELKVPANSCESRLSETSQDCHP